MNSASISQLKTLHQFRAFTPKIVVSRRPIVSLPFTDNHPKRRVILRCAKEAEKMSIERELNIEEEMIGMKKFSVQCREIGGIVELMECLEREAIMGDDDGREPNDYNRRAQIFDKSSRVFQALKQKTSAAASGSSSAA